MKNNIELIKSAIVEYQRIELQKMDTIAVTPVPDKEAIDKRILKSIDDWFKKEELKNKTIKTPIKILIAAAIITALIITCISCADIIRNFFVEISDIAIDISGKDEEEIIGEVKDSIEEVYVPSYIPADFELSGKTPSISNPEARWVNTNCSTDRISFYQLTLNGFISIDNEHALKKGLKNINGIETYYVLNDKRYAITWEQYGYLFSLICPESIGWDEIEKIVSSLEVNNRYEE